MTVAGTRVLKAHVDAAKKALHDNLAGFVRKEVDGETLARRVAEAVVCATDDVKTYYCVGVRFQDGGTMIYGPLATRAAGERVIARGQFLTQPGAQAAVWPLIPAGKR